MERPIIDAHCDLLSYLTRPGSDIMKKEDIGCAIPYLKEGNVKLQVMAIFAPTETKSHEFGLEQSSIFNKLISQENPLYLIERHHLDNLSTTQDIGMVASIESAAAFCDEDIPLKQGFSNLENIIRNVSKLFYISLTHHTENRFGGGNYSEAGLKDDGKALIDYIDNRNIAIDLSHTSDALALGILDYVAKQNLTIPIIASHSNYRAVFDHPRNLTDEIAKEIIHQRGLIGFNFLRAFTNNEDPEVLYDHIAHGVDIGGENAICYGADFFYTKGSPDKSRIPFYFKEYENATRYKTINNRLEEHFGSKFCDKISHLNAARFLKNLWPNK